MVEFEIRIVDEYIVINDMFYSAEEAKHILVTLLKASTDIAEFINQ